MAFEHWIYPLAGAEKVLLDFIPGSPVKFGEDWYENFAATWREAAKRNTYRSRALPQAAAEYLIETRGGENYEPDWYGLTMAVGRASGLLRVVRHGVDIYPGLRDLLAPEEE